MSTNLTDDDIESLRDALSTNRSHGSDAGTSPGDVRRENSNRRRARLPSDLACYRCTGAIEHGERAYGSTFIDGWVAGVNRHGEFDHPPERGVEYVVCGECYNDE